MLKSHTLFKIVLAWLSPAIIIFLSSNFVNAGNMLFNLAFTRLMGPEIFSDLAFILTIKLSLLNILNAIQMLTTEDIARADHAQRKSLIAGYSNITRKSTIILLIALPIILIALAHEIVASKLNLSSVYLLPIFVLAIPLYLPLSIWRGVAQGKADLGKMVLSANAEMLVRLLGGIMLYFVFGIEGVIIAFGLSILAAWYFAKPNVVNSDKADHKMRLRKALPWAAAQMAIVLVLDGEVILAKIFWDDHTAGLIASLSLVQRIVFFASFALTSVMIPQVIEAMKEGRSGIRQFGQAFGLFTAVTGTILIIFYMMPTKSVFVLFGEAYISIASNLLTSGLIAACATATYLLISFAMARGHYIIAKVYLLGSIVQVALLTFLLSNNGTQNIGSLLNLKLIIQFIFLTILFLYILYLVRSKEK